MLHMYGDLLCKIQCSAESTLGPLLLLDVKISFKIYINFKESTDHLSCLFNVFCVSTSGQMIISQINQKYGQSASFILTFGHLWITYKVQCDIKQYCYWNIYINSVAEFEV